MKLLRLFTLFLLVFALSCSDDDSSDIENGTNKNPNLKATGSSAHAFLSDDEYDSLVVEIFYVENFRPNSQTLTNWKNFMEARLNKPGGITFSETEIESPGNSPYTLDEITALENNIRTKYNSPKVLTMFVLFLDGKFTTDTSNTFTLGTAYRNTSFVIYENSIQILSNNVAGANRTRMETTVVLHEFCHLLGLVNFGTKMQNSHQDTAHGQHCNNDECLMFWQAENNMASGIMNNIPQLDANCLADLRANGGK